MKISSCYHGNTIFRVALQSGVILIKEFKHFILKLVESQQEKASHRWAGLGCVCQAATARDYSFNLFDIRRP